MIFYIVGGCVLEHIKGATYYVKGVTNVGIFVFNEKVYVVDPGNSRRALNEISERFNGFEIVLLNTHHHADHTFLNYMYEKKFNSPTYIHHLETDLLRYPEMSGYFLFSAETPSLFKKSFFTTKPVKNVLPFSDDIPLKVFHLPGHTPGHSVFLMEGGVLFSGDLFFSKEIVDKHYYPYHFSVKELKNSIKKIHDIEFSIVVPSHGTPITDPTEEINYMLKRIEEIENEVLELLKIPHSIEEIAFVLMKRHELNLKGGLFYLFRSFISSLITDLEDELREVSGKWERI